MKDRFGRRVEYLRISVTDRCNLRCTYCIPEEGLPWLPRRELLSYEEISRLVGIFVQRGVRKVRITGGEPTVRADLLTLVRKIGSRSRIRDLALSTNGLHLRRLAGPFAAAGLQRVNVSLDSLDPGVSGRSPGVVTWSGCSTGWWPRRRRGSPRSSSTWWSSEG